MRGSRVVGYLIGIRKNDEIWGPNMWVDAAGHAVETAEDVRDLYAAAAARWVEEERVRHFAMLPAWDAGLVEAWSRLSFGQQHASGIREVPDVSWPEGVRRASADDMDALVELDPLLQGHQLLAPVFSGGGFSHESDEELRAELLEDIENDAIGNLIAERDGRVVGAFQVSPAEHGGIHAGLARPNGAALINWAATQPDVRGSGAGLALTQGAFTWAREHGYETMVTDWRVTNLLSSRFWPARGFRTTFLRLYRHIP